MSILSSLGLAPTAAVVDDVPPPSITRLLRHVAEGAYQEADKLLLSASHDSRDRLIDAFARQDDAIALAQQWTRACSGSAIAHTVLGASMIVNAWKIRGDGRADDVDGDAWQPFENGLNQAAEPLLKASRLDTAAIDQFGWLIVAEVGKGGGDRDLVDSYFAQANARVARHWPTYYKYSMATLEKWGGSHTEMFRFAEQSAQGAPRGSMIHCLMAVAYCEYALALEDDIYTQVRSSSHAARISASLYAWLDASPATLEDKLNELSGAFAALGLNHFAMACYLCGATREAKALVAALNREIMTVPWAWIAHGMRENHHLGFVHDRVQRELARA